MKTIQPLRQVNFAKVKSNNKNVWEIDNLDLNTKLTSEERFSKLLNKVFSGESPIVQDIDPIELVTNKISISNWFLINAYKLDVCNRDSYPRLKDDPVKTDISKKTREIFINPENFYISFIGSSLIKHKYKRYIYSEFEFNRKLNKFVEKKLLTYDYINA